MLPRIEEQALFDQCLEEVEMFTGFSQCGFDNSGHPRCNNTVVPAYLCPEDVTAESNGHGIHDGIGGPTCWAVGHYAANYFVFGRPSRRSTEGANSFSDIPDGTASTVMFGERYGNCTNSGRLTQVFTCLWSDSTDNWRPIFCTNRVKSASVPISR
mgnify:FL=1